SRRPSRSAIASCCCRRIRARSRPRSIAWPAVRRRPRLLASLDARFTPCCLPTRSRTRTMPEVAAIQRPEIYREPLGPDQFDIIENPLPGFENPHSQGVPRKLCFLAVLAALWEGYARWLDNELLVPNFSATVRALIADIVSGTIIERAFISTQVLLIGY